MVNEVQERKNYAPEKNVQKKRADIILTESRDEWKVRITREVIRKYRSVFDVGFFFDPMNKYVSQLDEEVHEHYFGTEAESLDFIKRVVKELKEKNYDISAQKIITVRENLLEEKGED